VIRFRHVDINKQEEVGKGIVDHHTCWICEQTGVVPWPSCTWVVLRLDESMHTEGIVTRITFRFLKMFGLQGAFRKKGNIVKLVRSKK
jgi:hypothetical protein